MSSPKLFNRAGPGELKRELAVLLVLSAVLAAYTFGLPWAAALGLAPIIAAGLVLAIAGIVEVLWLAVTGADRIGATIGMRKSPLQ